MKTTRELLGARIKELRKRQGVTQEQLAEKVDLATRYISLIEVGRSTPSLETVENLATALGVEIKDLFEFGHLDPERVSPEGLSESLKGMDDKSRQLLYRIAHVMTR